MAMQPAVEPKNVIRYNSIRGEEVALSLQFVRDHFCANATNDEALAFIRFCEAHQLNPFLRDAYLIKYDPKEGAQMVVGYQVWIQKAVTQKDFKGSVQGLIIKGENGELERRQSLFYLDDEDVVGGWCKVLLEGREDVMVEVPVHEYIQTTRGRTRNLFWVQKNANTPNLSLIHISEPTRPY